MPYPVPSSHFFCLSIHRMHYEIAKAPFAVFRLADPQEKTENETVLIHGINASTLSTILLYGDPDIEDDRNRIVLETVIKYILSTSRLSGSLFDTVP